MPNFIEIGGGSRKFSKKLVDLTRNDPIIMFIKRFVVFSTLHFWHEFLLCVSRAGTLCWVMVGAMLDHGWHKVG